MAITTLSMVLTVFVLNLHHISERPIPGWARNVLFVGLARIMGMYVLGAIRKKMYAELGWAGGLSQCVG